jgi:hypothetical protein
MSNLLSVSLSIDPATNIFLKITFSGPKVLELQKDITDVSAAFLGKTIEEIKNIKIINSYPLSIFYSGLDEYLGHAKIKKNNNDLVCLCFGITSLELDEGKKTSAGRACGSCLPYVRPRTFKKIQGFYSGPLVVKLDQLKNEWATHQNIKITIKSIKDDKIDVEMIPYSKEKLLELSQFWQLKLGNRFFLRGTL